MHFIDVLCILSSFYFFYCQTKTSFEGRNKSKLNTLILKYRVFTPIHWKLLALLYCCFATASLVAQVRVPFSKRSSVSTNSIAGFSVHGDYSLIGNTNLTLVNYQEHLNNNNNAMQYVDIDNDPLTWNSSSADLQFSTENGANPSCSSIIYAGLYWTGRTTADGAASSPNEFTVTKTNDNQTITKIFNKKHILFKGPNATAYQEIIAEDRNIYYPNFSDAFIYSAYADVTNYVRLHGAGTYFAADIALAEGNGSSTGFSGGWGLVVVYANDQMKQRDITVYDGHAFVLNGNSSGYLIDVSGFHALQMGPVGVKLGVMASEGDVGLGGDFFQIQKRNESQFVNLQHELNSADNFFNSSNTTAVRQPQLQNNTGIDIGTFSLLNANNELIGNNQTSTKFRYGTVGDTYAIFALVLAVDSYTPEIENIVSISSVAGQTAGEINALLPGQEFEVTIQVRNKSTEPLRNVIVELPLPFNTTYIPESANGTLVFNSTTLSQSALHHNAAGGAQGSLVWDIGALPLPADSNELLATVQCKLRVTDDCHLLRNSQCSSAISINGDCSGIGSLSGIPFTRSPFILGKHTDGICSGSTIAGPLLAPIESASYIQSHCASQQQVRDFAYCGQETSVPVAELLAAFPPGSVIYSEYPITSATTSFAGSDSLPLTAGSSSTYFAVSSQENVICALPFTLTKCATLTATSDQGQTISSNLGGLIHTNILANDQYNDQPASIANVQISIINSPISNISINGTGLTAGPGMPPGNYAITYQICSLPNNTLCRQAQVLFTVITSGVLASDDLFEYPCGTSGIAGNILLNDQVNGSAALPNDLDIELIYTSHPDLSINRLTGELILNQGVEAGSFQVQYKIAPKNAPLDFSTANATITVADHEPPAVPLLPDLVDFCSITVGTPVGIDNCDGTLAGYTVDPLYYDEPGNYTVHWQFTDQHHNSSFASQQVSVKNEENSIPAYGYVDCNLDNDESLNIELNAFLPEGTNRNGAWTTSGDTTNFNGSVFSPYLAPTGNYDFTYLYEEGDCRQTAFVTIEVNNDCYVAPACNLLVHNSFSPNNDGINEVFIIENIDQTDCFPSNSVEIYNRWGVLVYKTKQYDNHNRVFRGISDGRATVSESDQLPTGTYFYAIKYTDTKGNEHETNGYVYLVM